MARAGQHPDFSPDPFPPRSTPLVPALPPSRQTTPNRVFVNVIDGRHDGFWSRQISVVSGTLLDSIRKRPLDCFQQTRYDRTIGQWLHEQMDVLRHDDESEQLIPLPFDCPIKSLTKQLSPRIVRQQRHSPRTRESQLVAMPRLVVVLHPFPMPVAHRANQTVTLLDKPAVSPGVHVSSTVCDVF